MRAPIAFGRPGLFARHPLGFFGFFYLFGVFGFFLGGGGEGLANLLLFVRSAAFAPPAARAAAPLFRLSLRARFRRRRVRGVHLHDLCTDIQQLDFRRTLDEELRDVQLLVGCDLNRNLIALLDVP